MKVVVKGMLKKMVREMINEIAMKILNEIYTQCKILSQKDYDDHIEFQVSGTENAINQIIRQIKK